MPTLYPAPLPDAVRRDPRKGAEVSVYDALAVQLPSGWEVFHSVAWVSKGEGGGLWDGEADFVIAHPERGLLVLEVKGGGIIHDAPTGKWASRDAQGAIHNIQDPFAQATRSKHALVRKLAELPALSRQWITAAHAVCFPNSQVGKADLGPQAPRSLILDADELGQLRPRLEAILQSAQTDRHQPLGGPGMGAIRSLLARSFELRMPLARAAEAEDAAMLRLSEAQFQTLDGLSRNRRMVVTGCAGSGKSLLAAEKARRLAAEGFTTLLTCFNIPLEAHLRDSLGAVPGLTVSRFHRLCHKAGNAIGLGLPPMAPAQREPAFWSEVLPDALVQACAQGQPRFDAIVVDEAQDFTDAYWLALSECLADPKQGVLYAFQDNTQSLFGGSGDFTSDLPVFELPANLRNTHAIRDIAARFGPAGASDRDSPQGRPVEVIALKDGDDLGAEVGKVVQRLTGPDGLALDGVAVLTARKPETLGLAQGSPLGGRSTAPADAQRAGHVVLDTIHRFKGLESPAVVLTGLEGMHRNSADTLLYVGVTRARNHLVVVEREEVLRNHRLLE